jgi:hypothetical protein
MVSNDTDDVLIGQFQTLPLAGKMESAEQRFISDIIKLQDAHERKERDKTMVVCEFNRENLELCLEMSKNYFGLDGVKLTLGVMIDIAALTEIKGLLRSYSDTNFMWCFTGITKNSDEACLKKLEPEIQERSLYLVDADRCQYNPFEEFFDRDGLVASINRNQAFLVPENCHYVHLKYFPPEINKKSSLHEQSQGFISLMEDALCIQESLHTIETDEADKTV